MESRLKTKPTISLNAFLSERDQVRKKEENKISDLRISSEKEEDDDHCDVTRSMLLDDEREKSKAEKRGGEEEEFIW